MEDSKLPSRVSTFLEAFSGEEILMDKPKLPEYAPLFSEAELQLD